MNSVTVSSPSTAFRLVGSSTSFPVQLHVPTDVQSSFVDTFSFTPKHTGNDTAIVTINFQDTPAPAHDTTFLLIGNSAGSSVAKNTSHAPEAELYPNPSTGINTLNYWLASNEVTSVELFNEAGANVASLYSKNESAGSYTKQLTLPSDLHGSYFVRLTHGAQIETLPLTIK